MHCARSSQAPSPRSVTAIAKERGCILPAPCGRGAGAHGADLPCDCETIALDGRQTPTAAEVRHVASLWAIHDEGRFPPQFVGAVASSLRELWFSESERIREMAERWFTEWGDDDGPWTFEVSHHDISVPALAQGDHDAPVEGQERVTLVCPEHGADVDHLMTHNGPLCGLPMQPDGRYCRRPLVPPGQSGEEADRG